jgi:hypothetical protein
VVRFHYGVPRVFSKKYRFPKKRSARLPSGRPTLKGCAKVSSFSNPFSFFYLFLFLGY